MGEPVSTKGVFFFSCPIAPQGGRPAPSLGDGSSLRGALAVNEDVIQVNEMMGKSLMIGVQKPPLVHAEVAFSHQNFVIKICEELVKFAIFQEHLLTTKLRDWFFMVLPVPPRVCYECPTNLRAPLGPGSENDAE